MNPLDRFKGHQLGAYSLDNKIEYSVIGADDCITDTTNVAYCVTLGSIDYTIALRETLDEYKVNNVLYSDAYPTHALRLKITDTFNPLNRKYSYSSSSMDDSCALSSPSPNQGCNIASEWSCATKMDGFTPNGCYPAK